jgi:Leucine-rich repeat (LRR) protein
MNTSKSILGEWKKRSQSIALNTFYSQRFREYEKFRETIVQMIQNPLDQLELSFRSSWHGEQFDLEFLEGIKKISAYGYQVGNLPLLIRELSLENCDLLKGIIFPPVRNFAFLSDRNSPRKSIDLNGLKNLEEASFRDVKLINYRVLSGLQSLNIASDRSLSDISCFRNVQKLTFYNCPGIRDVSSLRNARELEFFLCLGITDVSSLGRVQKLTLLGCTGITDVSALKDLHTLDLVGCPGVTDVSCLTNIHELRLTQFQGNKLSGLLNVKKLTLGSCPNITDISMLKTLKNLSVDDCPRITRFDGLHNLREFSATHFHPGSLNVPSASQDFPFGAGKEFFQSVNYFDAFGFTFSADHTSGATLQWNKLVNVKTLKLKRCVFDELPNIFSRLQSLTLNNCTTSELPSELPYLGYLNVESCVNISKLVLFGTSDYPVYSIKISDCAKLQEVQMARKVSKLELKRCDSLMDVELSGQVGHLKIIKCPNCRIVATSALIVFQDIRDHYEGDEPPRFS